MPELKIKNAVLRAASDTLIRIAGLTTIPASARWTAGQLAKTVSELSNQLGQAEITVFKKYALLDEKGDFVPRTDADGFPVQNSWQFKDPADTAAKTSVEAELKELLETENVITSSKLKLSALESTNVTGLEMLSIEAFVDPEA